MPRNVLVIDAIAIHRIRFAALLEMARYRVATAANLMDFPGDVGDHDLILLGLPDDRPGAALGPLAPLIQRSNVPVLCLDAKTSPLRRLLAMRAGARDILPSKSPDDLLLARVRGMIREGEAERERQRRRATAASFGFSEATARFDQRAQILCAGDLGTLSGQLATLTSHHISNLPAESSVVDDSDPVVPDVIILDAARGRNDLTRLLPELRDQHYRHPAPAMVLYPEDEPGLAIHALAMGADEVVVDSAGVEEIALRINKMLKRKRLADALRRSDEQSYELAMTDDLTGLFNRRYADRYLAGLTARPDRSAAEFCIVLVDLDHFKAVNDTYGHATGDIVLRDVARRLAGNLRACDLLARYGGEEFLIVLPDTPPETAEVMAERLRRAICLQNVELSDGLEVPVTVSMGIASGTLCSKAMEQRTGTFDLAEPAPESVFMPVFKAADAALYRAKDNGRNRVEVSDV